MRFINAKQLIEEDVFDLQEFEGNIPKYAILTHTWGEEEISFRDVADGENRAGSGFDKIKEACRLTWKDNLEYIWIDTCCIDKSSSAELTESINSMFWWYKNAEVCYAYLSDLVSGGATALQSDLPSCRWFTRGWTLQELIAPKRLEFYDGQWRHIGSGTGFKISSMR